MAARSAQGQAWPKGKQKDIRPRKYHFEADVQRAKDLSLSCPLLWCGLRFDVQSPCVEVGLQLRNEGCIDLVGQRIRAAAGFVQARDSNCRPNLQTGSCGGQRANGGQRIKRVQAVVTLLVVLPAFTAVFEARVKLTVVPAVTFTVRDSVRVALRVTVPMFEFAACACESGTDSPIKNRAVEMTQIFWKNRIFSP